jgi:hypothetical protein
MTPLVLIALVPWSPWVCVVFCGVMGAVGVGAAAYFPGRHAKILRPSLACES